MSVNGAQPASAVNVKRSLITYVSSIAGTYVFLALSFATSIYLTRRLGADGFGRLTLALTVAQTATIFAAFWSHAGFLRYGAEELARRGDLREVFWGRTVAVLPAMALVVTLGWLFRDRIAEFHGIAAIGFVALLLYVFTLVASQTLQVVYQARGRAGSWSFLQAGERTVILVVLLWLAADDPRTIFVIYVAASAMLALAGLVFTSRRDFIPVEASRESVRRFMVFSWPILIGVFGSYFASNWLDIAVIRHYLDSAAVGQYAVAYQIMGAVQQIPMLSFPVVVPLLVGAYVEERHGSLQLYLDRVVPHALFLMVALLFAGILAGAPLVPLVFGQSFVESARVLPVLLLAVGFYCVFIAYIPILNVRERTGGMLAASAAAAATNVAGDLLLVPAWGILGAAWATVCAQCASGTVVAWLAHREHPFSFGPAVSFLSALVVVVIAWTLLDGWPAATAAAAAALLLALAGRRYRLGSPSDQRMLASLGVPALQRWLPVLAAERS